MLSCGHAWRARGKRTTDWKEIITADPEVMVGKPVIAGTRLTVEFIVERRHAQAIGVRT